MGTPKLLTTKEASAYLAGAHGIKRTPGTLSIDRVRGGGPKFRTVGKRQIRYTPVELDEYAASAISAPTISTSEAAARVA